MKSKPIILLFLTFLPLFSWGWGDHPAITRAAISVLPEWQRQAFAGEREPLEKRYSLIPDKVATDLENRPLVEGFFAPDPLRYNGRSFVNFHLPFSHAENYSILRYQVVHVLGALSTNNVPLAARYMGILAHILEDWTCPAHTTVNDNMFTLLTQYFPPPESMKYKLFHSPIESGGFEVSIPGYLPENLGNTPDEIAFNLLWKSQQGLVFARGRTGAILLATYAEDLERSRMLQRECAVVGAKLVADAFNTLWTAAKRPVSQTYAALPLENLFPEEQPNLYWPQSAFVGKPYWGHPTVNVILKDGREPVELALTEQGKRKRVSGIGCGSGSKFTYVLPKDLYGLLSLTVGLQSDLGDGGHVMFSVWGNGKQLSETSVRGAAESVPLRISLAGVTNLQIQAITVRGARAESGYAVWGDPVLHLAQPTP